MKGFIFEIIILAHNIQHVVAELGSAQIFLPNVNIIQTYKYSTFGSLF